MKVKNLYKSILIGLYIVIIGLALSGCEISSYSSNGEYEEKKYTSKNSVDKIIIDNYGTDTIFTTSKDNNFHVTCYENNKYNYEIVETDDRALNIEKKDLKKFTIFELASDLQRVTIEIPKSFQGDIKVNAGRAELLLNGINASNIQLESSRGKVKIDDVTVFENIMINGYRDQISFSNIKAGNEILVENQRGDINLENIEFGFKLKINNYRGDIIGKINGSINDYSITCIIERGDCNLPDKMEGGSKDIHLQTSRGNINITFDK